MSTERKQTRRLLIKLLAFSLPFILFVLAYIIIDPFKVIRYYDDYNSGMPVYGNRDVVSSEKFLKNYPVYHYKSFIFGNSRSEAFLTKDWSYYIKDTISFHFDANAESLYGIWIKLKYLDKINDSIKNVLIVSDETLYNEVKDDPSVLFIKDYKISGTSLFDFQLVFFKGFLSNYFFVRCFDYKIFGTYRSYMKNYIPDYCRNNSSFKNDIYETSLIADISKDSINYYKKHADGFKRGSDSGGVYAPVIGEEQLKLLLDIKKIFLKHKTKYKIIISPLYSEAYFNPDDLKQLQETLGTENIYDFSGKNSITDYMGNYYEQSHYKIFVGKRILRTIYGSGRN